MTTRRLLQVVAMGLLWVSASGSAQTFITIKSFGILTNITGFNPQSALVQGPDGALYGTTPEGAYGTVFKVQSDGSGFTLLKLFTNTVEGAYPRAGLTLSGGVFYGTTAQGGNSNAGTVFKMSADGSGYAVLKHFAGSNAGDGSGPQASLTLSGNVLYGTTGSGGSSNLGTVFKLNIDGTGYTRLKSFTGVSDGWGTRSSLTLSDGMLYGCTSGGGGVFRMDTNGGSFAVLARPGAMASLTLSGGTLYGTTEFGGNFNDGTIFKVNIDGTGFAVLKHCNFLDGARPHAGLILSGNTLYGTMFSGGGPDWNDGGAVFKMSTDGTGYTVLKHFMDVEGAMDGAFPSASLVLSGNTLYGTTYGGGPDYFRSYDEIIAGNGTVFKVNTDGTGYAVLKYLTDNDGDGASPQAGVTLSSNVVYGTTMWGGSSKSGTVFKMNADGTSYAVLKHFGGNDGVGPAGGVTLSGNTLYGTTMWGGSANSGTVFRMDLNGSGYTALKQFRDGEGRYPSGGLVLSGATLYGTTAEGGSVGVGTVFRIKTDGLGYTVLKHCTDSDGANPYGGLILSGNTLYGTASSGGNSSRGTVFKVNIDGTGYTLLKRFAAGDGGNPYGGLTLSGSTLYGTTSAGGGTVFKMSTNGTDYTVLKALTVGEGIVPRAGLALFGDGLYGTTTQGGSAGRGTLFKVTIDGTGYVVLKHFTGSDGANPEGDLKLVGSTLFGATRSGGSLGQGTVFKVELSGIRFDAGPSGSIILNWIDTAFGLQAAAEVMGPYTNVSGAASPRTNAISEPRRFFRLIGN